MRLIEEWRDLEFTYVSSVRLKIAPDLMPLQPASLLEP